MNISYYIFLSFLDSKIRMPSFLMIFFAIPGDHSYHCELTVPLRQFELLYFLSKELTVMSSLTCSFLFIRHFDAAILFLIRRTFLLFISSAVNLNNIFHVSHSSGFLRTVFVSNNRVLKVAIVYPCSMS